MSAHCIRNQRGAALVVTLGLAMLLLPLGAFAVLRCHTHVLIQHNLRSDIEGLYVAEAGLTGAVAQMRPSTTFDVALSGPDRIAGTQDDGVLALGPSISGALPVVPAIRIEPAAGGVRILSTAMGPGATSKVVEALLTLDPLPFTPASAYLEGDATMFDLGTEGFLLSGLDHAIDDPPDAPQGPSGPVAALSTPDAAIGATLRSRLGGYAAQLPGAGVAPSVASADAIDVVAYATGLQVRPERTLLPPLTVNAGTVLGTESVPQLSVVAGDCDVADDLTGGGILVVQGMLRVTGTMRFVGLVVALGGVVFEASSHVELVGALWHGAGNDPRLQFQGTGAVAYSSAALALADTAFPHSLLHATRVVGWAEHL
jgi:hypothetical protein